jgi:hypothetical protein
MLVLRTEIQNVKWLGVANKYLEHQYNTRKDTWSKEILVIGGQKDKYFEKEFDFIIACL